MENLHRSAFHGHLVAAGEFKRKIRNLRSKRRLSLIPSQLNVLSHSMCTDSNILEFDRGPILCPIQHVLIALLSPSQGPRCRTSQHKRLVEQLLFPKSPSSTGLVPIVRIAYFQILNLTKPQPKQKLLALLSAKPSRRPSDQKPRRTKKHIP